ncbi:MAG: PTS sugar transporter subunit IIC/EAL domain-containing protein [Firmicutes bacterium]|nr:PTS sugar transporter subunit IIC/EAL domain-containing protein [Bacillota bacterium]
MQTKDNKFMTWLYQKLNTLNRQRHLYSIRTAFIATMPIMIVGAYAVVFNQLPIAAYQEFMVGVFGERWHIFGELAFNATTQIATLMVAFLLPCNLARWYNSNRAVQAHEGICGTVALASYMAVSLPVEGANALCFGIVGVNGLFVAIVVSLIAGEAMIRLACSRRNTELLSDDPNMAVPQSFASILPAVLVIGSFVLLRTVVVKLGIPDGFTDILNNFWRLPYRGDSAGTAILYNVSTHFMWLFGIHGNNVLDEVAQTVFVPAMEANVAAAAAGMPAPNLVTKTLFDTFVYMGGSGTTLALLVALLLFGRGRNQRTMMKYALPNSMLNINEPVIFGIPIALNPFYAIPFVLTPVVMFFTTTAAMKLGFVPYTIADVPWSTPIFISGYTATGSIAGIVMQFINLIIAVMIYTPFVRLSEKMAQMTFSQAFQELTQLVTGRYDTPALQLTTRVDGIGAVARNLANQLDTAMAKGDIFLNYQPIVDVQNRKINSVEALLRWRHPEFGAVNPMVAVTLAEETELISTLGMYIFEQAISQRAEWTKQGLGDFHVSVNISTRQLNDPQFYQKVLDILARFDVPAHQLQVEITEAAALVENVTTNNNLQQLHDAGATIAMDDFGVGHSSLLYLRTQPITTLKIDGSLSRDVVENPANLDIIATIYDLSRLLKLETVVEFVETEAQLDKLMTVGSFLVQGYFYSPPLAGDKIPEFFSDFDKKLMSEGKCPASTE